MVDCKYRLKQGDNGEEQTDHLQKDMIDGFDHSCWLHFEKLEMQTCMSPQYHLGGLSAAKKLSRCSGSGVVRKWIVWARLWEGQFWIGVNLEFDWYQHVSVIDNY